MKIKNYSILIVAALMFLLGCSKDDDFELLEPEIVFVNTDGNSVLEGWCINSNESYALQITLKSNGSGKLKSKKKIDYTINGVPYSVTFTELGTKTIPVNFIEGTNVAQLIESGNSISLEVVFCNAKIVANKISFVYADGSEIPEGVCLDLSASYAVKIETVKEGTGDLESTEIAYTLNGVVYSTTFTEITNKLLPVTLSEGENVAQLIASGNSANLNVVLSCNAKIIANKISFVYADGSEIPEGVCLDLSASYAVKIETEKEGTGDLESTEIAYTLNGVVYSTTFTEITNKLLPVTLSEGENVAQLIASGNSANLNVVLSCNAKIIANKISFVYADGSEILEGACLDFNADYGIYIEVIVEGTGKIEPTEIEYTLNGVVYKMVFTEGGSKLNTINIIEGENIVQIIGTNLESSIRFITQGDFILIE